MKDPFGRIYLFTGTALLAFLALTIGAAYINLGPLNSVIAMSISVAKAALIILFFMHMRYSKPVMWLVFAAGFFWLGIMFVLGMSDYMSRGWR
jgi:cytochrome c oxidase subunit IV